MKKESLKIGLKFQTSDGLRQFEITNVTDKKISYYNISGEGVHRANKNIMTVASKPVKWVIEQFSTGWWVEVK